MHARSVLPHAPPRVRRCAAIFRTTVSRRLNCSTQYQWHCRGHGAIAGIKHLKTHRACPAAEFTLQFISSPALCADQGCCTSNPELDCMAAAA